jgi:hypothetical protein
VNFPESVESRVAAEFARAAVSQARNALPSADQLASGAPYERVLLAILQLASGDISKLLHFTAAAIKDWRDVLYWTEQPVESDEPLSWEELKERLRLPDA